MPSVLDLVIRRGDEDTYRVDLFERGKEQPLARSNFECDTSYMASFEISRLDSDRRDPHERLKRLRDFGGKLYTKIFNREIETLWNGYRKKSDFLTLCIRIAPEADSLEILPWETMHDGDEYIGAGIKTGLTRLPLDIQPQDDLPEIPLPVEMLALISSPLDLADQERLAIEREQELILQATNSPAGRGRLHVEFEDEAKLPIIEQSLEGDVRIFHYSGHGISPRDGGGLLLEDSEGKKRPTPVSEVLQSLQRGERTLRLAVLSGCQTARTMDIAGFRDLARGLAHRGIPAVIAMQFSIADSSGLNFAETLYPRIVEGQSLDIAVSASRRALLQDDDPHVKADALAPVLILSGRRPLRTGAADVKATTEKRGIDFRFYLPLPQLSFGFYGRRKEYRAIRDGLLVKNHRAIIVYGIGGIGKTALISHAASRIGERFEGVYAFDCRSGTLAPDTILLELHRFLERQGCTLLAPLMHRSFPPEQLATFMSQVLSQCSLLVIFDNFENHLTQRDGKHEIADENLRLFLFTLIKATGSGSRFLFTSRYLFDIDEKRIGPVQFVPLRDLTRPEALGLMQRLPNLASATFEDKMQVFDRFGGHPYALVTLDRHCGKRKLEEVMGDAREVHAELREFIAIEMSYAKLSDRCRELLHRMAAFRKPVGYDAGRWVLGEKVEIGKDIIQKFDRERMPEEFQSLNDDELLDMLRNYLPEQRRAQNIDEPVDELIGWGLLMPVVDDEISGLTVHSLVREFCRDRISKQEWNVYLHDAALYYTNESKHVPEDNKTLENILGDIEACELLMEAGDYENAADIVIGADPLLDRWGFGRFLEALYGRIVPEVKKKTRGIIIHNMGVLVHDRGEYDKALEQYGKSLKIKEELGDRAGVSRSLHQIGMIHHDRGEYDKALEQYGKSLKMLEELGDRSGVSSSLHNIGAIHQARGEYDKALEQYGKSLKIKEELGDRAGVSRSLHQIGMIHQARGEYDKALEQYGKSLKILEELGDRAGVASSHGMLGRLYAEKKDFQEAFEHSFIAFRLVFELQHANRDLAVRDMKTLRESWGAKQFDAAWRDKTGEDPPDILK